MPRLNEDPARRCMPLAEWPALDRTLWEAAIVQTALLDDPGLAAHWRTHTRRSVIQAYGRYLTFLARNDWLDLEKGPEDRLSKEYLRAYIAELQAQVEPVTVAGRFRDLIEALRVMAPALDYPHLKLAYRRLIARAQPSRNKLACLVPSADILRLGLGLMREGESRTSFSPRKRGALYRDGLMIALLASRPLRRANFVYMLLEQHFFKENGRYEFRLAARETKGGREHQAPYDECLTPYIDRYLEHYRPQLLRGKSSDRLWISWMGTPMAENSVYNMVCARTKKAFGRDLCPHLLRDCAITSLGRENPELVWAGMAVLDHANPKTTEKHYDQALADRAVGQYQAVVQSERKSMMKLARSSRKGLRRKKTDT